MIKLYDKEISISDDTTAGKLLAFVGYDKTVLEIGCASGIQTKLLRDVFSCNVTGIEINDVAAEQAKQYCNNLIVGNIETLCLKECLGDSKFEVILMADVLEHLRHPDAVLQKLKSFLIDNNGYIVISIPNIVHASVVYQMTQGAFRYTDFGLLDDTHIRFFSKQGITELLNDSGYDIVEIRRVLCDPLLTEIKVDINSRDDFSVMNYIIKNNKESLVYQYVIKACVKSNSASGNISIDNRQDLDEMTHLADALVRQYSKKSSRVSFNFSNIFQKF